MLNMYIYDMYVYYIIYMIYTYGSDSSNTGLLSSCVIHVLMSSSDMYVVIIWHICRGLSVSIHHDVYSRECMWCRYKALTRHRQGFSPPTLHCDVYLYVYMWCAYRSLLHNIPGSFNHTLHHDVYAYVYMWCTYRSLIHEYRAFSIILCIITCIHMYMHDVHIGFLSITYRALSSMFCTIKCIHMHMCDLHIRCLLV